MRTQTRVLVVSIFLMYSIILSLYFWPKLPNCVPIHFNASGAADGYGPKSSLLVLMPAVQAFLAFLYFVSIRVVQTEEYWLKKIRKPMDPAVQRELMSRTVRFLDWIFFLLFLLFADVYTESLLVAAGASRGLSKMIWVIIVLMFVSVIFNLVSTIALQFKSGKKR